MTIRRIPILLVLVVLATGVCRKGEGDERLSEGGRTGIREGALC
jgi:hypothetical protein